MNATVKDGALRVLLSEAETEKYSLGLVFRDKDGENAGRILEMLLKAAAVKANFKTSATRFAIELYPVFCGGCEIIYTPRPETPQRAAVQRWSAFEFDTSEAMLQACEFIYRCPSARFNASALYKYRSKYRLTVKNLNSELHRTVSLDFADRVLSSLSQFGETVRHGEVICRKNAVAVIGAALSGEPI